MILQALHGLSQREGLTEDPDFEPKRVAWMVRIGPGGKFLGIEDARFPLPAEGKRKPRLIAKSFSIPRQPTGRSGTKAPPCFLVDNAKYVFGLPTKDKSFPPGEGKEKADWFRDMVHSCAMDTKDDAITAVGLFLNDLATGKQAVTIPDDCKSNDLFAFIYSPDAHGLVHDRPKVRDYWRQQRRSPEASDRARWLCLVSGQSFDQAGLFPLIENVPGASPSRIGLVSFNKDAFLSYGWQSNENAPISRQAAESCATALNRLLHPAYPNPSDPEQALPRRNLRLSGNTAVCFWSADQQGDEFCSVFSGLLEANPDQVKEMYHSVWRGRPSPVENPAAFYALTLTGSQGRVIVRDWFESTIAQVAGNLSLHFADLDIVRNTPRPKDRDLPPQIPMHVLLEAIADPAKNRRDGVPGPLSARLIRAAFSGNPYPLALMQRAMLRYRAELGNEHSDKEGWVTRQWNDARVALIKAVLNRRKRCLPQTTSYKEVKPEMDPASNSPGYTLGCLMAVLERMQQEALKDINASVVDRYFSAASASPKAVFVRLLRNARHHSRKARDDERKGGLIFYLERLVDELASVFDPKNNGFPSHLNLEQQGLFILGFHQMRRWLWMTKDERSVWERNHTDAPRAFQWTKEAAAAPAGQS